MRIIIGLGNPGREYEKTKHNVGFMAVDELASSLGIEMRKNKFQALYGEASVKGEKIVLVKPMTYMNLSGQSVRQVLDWYKPSLEEWAVAFDDMDLPVGNIRLREKGSSGGHNGIKSIIANLGAQEFLRVKIGVGRPEAGVTVVDHVLTGFPKADRPKLEEAIQKALHALKTYIESDFQTAMNRYN